MPECVKNDTKKYMDANDNIYNWVLEKYELTTNKEDVIKIKDMYEEYKKSDEYQNTYKKDRKTLKTFSSEVITHKYLKSKYVEELRCQSINEENNWVKIKYGVSKMRSVLIGIKEIIDDNKCYIEY